MTTLRILSVAADATDNELMSMMQIVNSFVIGENHGAVLVIAGYDDDHRELFDIPEVAKLCRTLVRIGFITILEFSSLLPPGKPQADRNGPDAKQRLPNHASRYRAVPGRAQ